MVHRTSQNVARRDGFRMLDERHDGVACNNIWHNRYRHVYDKAESPSSESSTPSGIPNEILIDSDGEMLEEYSLRTPSHVANSDNSHSKRTKKRRRATIMRTNDGTLHQQQWLWDCPYEAGDYWDIMRDTITSNDNQQPVADDLSDGYIADRMYWDAQHSVPQMPCTPVVLE